MAAREHRGAQAAASRVDLWRGAVLELWQVRGGLSASDTHAQGYARGAVRLVYGSADHLWNVYLLPGHPSLPDSANGKDCARAGPVGCRASEAAPRRSRC